MLYGKLLAPRQLASAPFNLSYSSRLAMESSSSIRSAHAAGSDDSTLDWPVGHPRISCRLLHFYVSSNLPIPIGLISQDRLLLRSLFLSEMFTEPTGGLQRKSTVYGLNGHRLYYIISLFKVTYKSTIRVSRNFHALFTRTLENSDTCD